MAEATVTLHSDEKCGREIPPKPLGELLRTLPAAIRYAIRMAFEVRSLGRGQPKWLSAASDIRLLGYNGDREVVLRFSVPSVGDSAVELYEQSPITRPYPDAADTGFDLLADVIHDISSYNTNSLRFDQALLHQVEKFRLGLNDPVSSFEFQGRRRKAIITREVTDLAGKLHRSMPIPQPTRVVGILETVGKNTNTFVLALKDGQYVDGVLIRSSVNSVADLLKREVLILGKVYFRPSGSIMRIDADEVIEATENDRYFSTPPKSRIEATHTLEEILKLQAGKEGVGAIFGRWPGDETDEEIEMALKESS